MCDDFGGILTVCFIIVGVWELILILEQVTKPKYKEPELLDDDD